MSRARVAVLKVVSHQLPVTQAAGEYGFSRRHLHGLDAGPGTVAWYLEQVGLRAPSTSTIRRILRQAG